MRTTVNPDTCIGCGLCVEICPELYEMNDSNIAVVRMDEVEDTLIDKCREAIDSCPAEAITLEE